MYAELTQKKCTKCEVTKTIERFQKNARYKGGHHTWCKDCKIQSQRAHPETNRKWTAKNKERSLEIKRLYVEKNPDKVKSAKKQWNDANPEKRLANCRKYQASKLNATPDWLTKEHLAEITSFYVNCPDGFHVDHIVPLRGKNVRGLHVPWNLQYLDASSNMRKSNRL